MSSEQDGPEADKIWIQGDLLCYSGEWGDWTLELVTIRIVGEENSGNPEDPWSRMVVFMVSEEVMESAPVTAVGLPDVLRVMESEWNTDLTLSLPEGEGPYRTVVMHPAAMRGKPFQILPEEDPDASREWPPAGVPKFEVIQPSLTPEVSSYLKLA